MNLHPNRGDKGKKLPYEYQHLERRELRMKAPELAQYLVFTSP